jgi:uncharacterized protein YndB with AHSA1/START domain
MSHNNFDTHRVQIKHRFAAPRTEIFSWWTTAEKLRQWSGCQGATKCEVTMDFRVGGSYTQKMFITGRGEFSFHGVYQEICEPERIVYTAQISPATTRVTVEFLEESEASTEVVITHEGLPNEMFRKNIEQGTTESLQDLQRIVLSQPVNQKPAAGSVR